jgi:hypothetical protein
MGMKQNFFFSKIEFKMADSKQLSFSKQPIINIFSQKFQKLVLGSIGEIDLKGINVTQPFMVIMLSDVRSKMSKKCLICVFGLF